MKRQNGLVLLTGVVLLLLASCAAQFQFVAPAMLSEAMELKVQCAKLTPGSDACKIADSLYSAGEQLIKENKHEAAYVLLDRAVVHYRIITMRVAIMEKEKEVALQRKALAKTHEDVSAYKQVLAELKTMEQQ